MDQFGVSEKYLAFHLRMAVPIWLAELAPKGEAHWMARKSVCAQVIAEKGDIILFGGKRLGQAGEAFNRLAEGCALLMLITKHPFELFGLKFNPNGSIEEIKV